MKKLGLIVVGIMLMLGLTACGKKEALTASSFKAKMETKGYEVVDISSDYEEGTIVSALIATKDDYQIEFYLVNDEEQAIRAFNQNKTGFEELKTSGSMETEVSLSNHAKYTLTTGGKYMVISRIGTTFVYVNVEDGNKSEVSGVLKDLNY